jgi:glyoxylase-like metal-dependent hydrolase (beta-lactamase superfamily II)
MRLDRLGVTLRCWIDWALSRPGSRRVVGRAIDILHRGLDRVICTYDVDGVIIDPGPSSCLETLLGELGDTEPRAVLLTHIHLDHAGGTGSLLERFPGVPVYVHEVGAPHLIDPSRLVASSRRVYGDDVMDQLWGEVRPVPERSVRVLRGDERVEGFRVAYTPGHASHHLAYLHDATGAAYVGDLAGVTVPPFDFTAPPTPPPDIDLEAWSSSLDILSGWRPTKACLTHFGPVEDVDEQILRTREGLARWGECARTGDRDAFVEALEREACAAGGREVFDRFFFAVAADQMYAGLERYWRRRAAPTASSAPRGVTRPRT